MAFRYNPEVATLANKVTNLEVQYSGKIKNELKQNEKNHSGRLKLVPRFLVYVKLNYLPISF